MTLAAQLLVELPECADATPTGRDVAASAIASRIPWLRSKPCPLSRFLDAVPFQEQAMTKQLRLSNSD